MYKYTLIFIKRKNQVLMLNRANPPMMGKWYGIGGKLEAKESADECVQREVYEETGIEGVHPIWTGNVSWVVNDNISGMHVFIAEVHTDFVFVSPRKVEEGILDWKDIGVLR